VPAFRVEHVPRPERVWKWTRWNGAERWGRQPWTWRGLPTFHAQNHQNRPVLRTAEVRPTNQRGGGVFAKTPVGGPPFSFLSFDF
jgi:hypothetical protein